MNFGIIICTHGSTGVEMLNSVRMITGIEDGLEAIEFKDDNSPEDVLDSYNRAIKNLNRDNYIILTDIKGGTPFNCAARIAMQNNNYHVLTGVNIPMIISLVLDSSDSIDATINNSLEEGKLAIEKFSF